MCTCAFVCANRTSRLRKSRQDLRREAAKCAVKVKHQGKSCRSRPIHYHTHTHTCARGLLRELTGAFPCRFSSFFPGAEGWSGVFVGGGSHNESSHKKWAGKHNMAWKILSTADFTVFLHFHREQLFNPFAHYHITTISLGVEFFSEYRAFGRNFSPPLRHFSFSLGFFLHKHLLDIRAKSIHR